ncbi:Hsp20/alpha crystallin family protein [Salinicoccus roseus]|jgi:HSP20 family protein|uniref:Heat-shock protein n=1 Tax=Salinicoccus roseus TaxID=45670 RepID=A0A265E4K7_9STAP|nr:Hsp20/alpha crystallin family protein [Salinicoccus roseus]OZT76435.1 heat-shock protein [Salinicoccus roseus]RPE51109.1 heat shock protein Hsp20 [Salinicoccus roseus]GGA77928.1 heat-shock protein [Salinicoccus roseus]
MAFEMKPFNNSFFDMNPSDIFRDVGRQLFTQFPESTMKSDIREYDHSYVLEAELPGIEKENINIEYNNGVLSISGEQSIDNEAKDDQGRVVHRERSYSTIKRQFAFDNIQQDGISADFNNGVLKITLPKTNRDNSSKRIEIN